MADTSATLGRDPVVTYPTPERPFKHGMMVAARRPRSLGVS
jgi:hypothetical protein